MYREMNVRPSKVEEFHKTKSEPVEEDILNSDYHSVLHPLPPPRTRGIVSSGSQHQAKDTNPKFKVRKNDREHPHKQSSRQRKFSHPV